MPAQSHLLLLTNRQRLFCCVFGDDVFREFLVGLSIYLSGPLLDDLKSCPVLGPIGCFGMSPGSVFAPRLSCQFVTDPGLVMLCSACLCWDRLLLHGHQVLVN